MVSRTDDQLPDEDEHREDLQKALLDYDRLLEAGLSREKACEASHCDGDSRREFDDLREMLDLLESVWPRGRKDDDTLPQLDFADEVLPPSTQIGRFRILRQLGRGGFGVVYLAEDPQLRRQVAIKLPRPEIMMTRELRRRFIREAHAAAALDHPHILPIFESGELGSVCYLVSPFCSRGSLSDVLARRDQPLTPRQVAELMLQLAEAIQYAHNAGILHRDLKPANILIEPNDDADRVGSDGLKFRTRIADFGLAHFFERDAADPPLSGDTFTTKSGAMLGTPQYMAPEQVNGDTQQVGPGADIYGLGAVLYQVLTGRPPFSAAGNVELLHQIVTKDPALPRSLSASIPADLEAICLKCIEKRPEHRYRSARELAEDLQRFLRGEATLARPLSAAQRLVRAARQRPVAALAVGSAVVLCLATVSGLIFHSARVQSYAGRLDASLVRERNFAQQVVQQRDVARQRERAAQQEAYASLMSRGLRMVQAGQTTSLCRLLQRVNVASDDIDLRGFEWRYLWSLGSVHAGLRGSLKHFENIFFSSDGEYCLTWTYDSFPSGTELVATDPHVYVWHVPTRRLQRKLACDGAPFAAAVLEGDQVITVAGYGTIQTWDLESGECVHSQRGPRLVPDWASPSTKAAFSTDGTKLVFSVVVQGVDNPQNELRLWDVRSRTIYTLPNPASARVQFIRFSNDGQHVAVSAMPHNGSMTLQVISVGTRQEIARLVGEKALQAGIEAGVPLQDVAFFPNGPKLAIGTLNGTLVTWNYESGVTSKRKFNKPDANVFVTVAHDGKKIVAALWDPKVRETQLEIVDENLESATPILGAGGLSVERVLFSPDGKLLAYGGHYGQFRLMEWERAAVPYEVIGTHSGEAWDVAFSADSQWIVSGSDDHTVRLWDRSSGKLQRTLKGHSSLVAATAFSPSGRIIASGSFDSKIRLWKPDSSKAVRTLSGHDGQIRDLAFIGEDRLVSVGADEQVRVWDLKKGRQETSLAGHTNKIRAVAVDQSAGLMVTAANDGAVLVWDAYDLKRLHSRTDDSEVQSLALSPDGSVLAAGSHRGTIWLYSMPTLDLIDTLEVGEEAAWALAFSADGRTLASGGRDAAVTLWNTATGQQMMTLPGTESMVYSLAFSADGETLAAATYDGRITIWRAPPPPPQSSDAQ